MKSVVRPRWTPQIVAAVAIAVAVCVPAWPQSLAVPSREECTFLELRMEGGWWLQLFRDRPATIGFGALPHWISVKDGTFSLDAVYDEIIEAIAESHHGAPVIATFGAMPGDGERGFGVVGVDALVADLFARAYRQRDQEAVGPFRQQDLNALEPFWADAPFLH